MRTSGLTLAAVLIAGSVGRAQPPSAQADPKLDAHLAAWEKRTASATNLRTEVALTRTDAVFKKDTNFKGTALCMKPNFARARLDNVDDKTKADYEAYICNGKAVYAYSGANKTFTEFEVPKAGGGVDNVMLDFLAGMKAKDVKKRFNVTLADTDKFYVYLHIKPLLGADQREFKQIHLALYGPGPDTAPMAYLPAAVRVYKPNGDTEKWTFTNLKVDLPDVTAKEFQYVAITDKGWKFQKAPPAVANGPVSAGTPPAGGAGPRDKP